MFSVLGSNFVNLFFPDKGGFVEYEDRGSHMSVRLETPLRQTCICNGELTRVSGHANQIFSIIV